MASEQNEVSVASEGDPPDYAGLYGDGDNTQNFPDSQDSLQQVEVDDSIFVTFYNPKGHDLSHYSGWWTREDKGKYHLEQYPDATLEYNYEEKTWALNWKGELQAHSNITGKDKETCVFTGKLKQDIDTINEHKQELEWLYQYTTEEQKVDEVAFDMGATTIEDMG